MTKSLNNVCWNEDQNPRNHFELKIVFFSSLQPHPCMVAAA